MIRLDRMERWVERRGKHVEFGNLIGPYVGKSYKYRCKTLEGAKALELDLNQRDPDNENMPKGLGEERALAEFGAVKVENERG